MTGPSAIDILSYPMLLFITLADTNLSRTFSFDPVLAKLAARIFTAVVLPRPACAREAEAAHYNDNSLIVLDCWQLQTVYDNNEGDLDCHNIASFILS